MMHSPVACYYDKDAEKKKIDDNENDEKIVDPDFPQAVIIFVNTEPFCIYFVIPARIFQYLKPFIKDCAESVMLPSRNSLGRLP